MSSCPRTADASGHGSDLFACLSTPSLRFRQASGHGLSLFAWLLIRSLRFNQASGRGAARQGASERGAEASSCHRGHPLLRQAPGSHLWPPGDRQNGHRR